MPIFTEATQFKVIEQFGLGGLDTLNDPSDINDIELADIRNMQFNDGILAPRNGSLLYLARPSGETNSPNQLLVATDSNGLDYMISVYGVNLYLADTLNKQWIKLNQTYTPTTGGLFYGSTNWNGGRGPAADIFYMGNGTDDCAKWYMGTTSLAVAALGTDTTLTLADSSWLPSSGTVLVQITGGSAFLVDYTANDVSTGVLTLTTTAGTSAPIDSTVTTQLVDVTTIPHGKTLFNDGTRLYSVNGITTVSGPSTISSENTINGSYFLQPENFTPDATTSTSFTYTPFMGSGGILGMSRFGQYIIFQKRDVIAQLILGSEQDDSTGAYSLTYDAEPIISGDGIGPSSNADILNYMNTLYYPTTTQGIISFDPNTTGSQTSSGVNVLSETIQNLVTESLDFNLSRTAGLGQKLYWACALPTIGINPAVNNIVLMYDLVRASENYQIDSGIEIGGSAWTVYDNWNAVDIKPVNEVLYYLSANDGAVYQCNVEGNFQDAILNNPVPYTAYAASKRFNLGAPANLNKCKYIYLEGYISLNTKFYVNLLFNEQGSLGTQSYVIAGTNSTITSRPLLGGLGAFVLGSQLLGGVSLQTLQNFQRPLFFRVYLETSQAYIWHNMQIQAFSNAVGSFWSITKAVLITEPVNAIDTPLVMDPGSIPVLNIQNL